MQGTQRLARLEYSIGKLPKFSLKAIVGENFCLN